ncbi:MAG: hypothetical protein M3463_06905 [Verrucomicrobiota bacterium]|nr:hypothetical protein [Verrucomicrobiota bacterium]
MKKLLPILTIAAIALGVPSSGLAAEKKAKSAAAPAPADAVKPAEKPAEAARSTQALPYRGDVAAVDAAAKTFTFKNKDGKERVFHASSKTRIMKDGAAADFDAISVGAHATGQYTKTADGKLELVSVKIGPKAEKTGEASDKPGAKKAQ